jgi:hypothetical protein
MITPMTAIRNKIRKSDYISELQDVCQHGAENMLSCHGYCNVKRICPWQQNTRSRKFVAKLITFDEAEAVKKSNAKWQ